MMSKIKTIDCNRHVEAHAQKTLILFPIRLEAIKICPPINVSKRDKRFNFGSLDGLVGLSARVCNER